MRPHGLVCFQVEVPAESVEFLGKCSEKHLTAAKTCPTGSQALESSEVMAAPTLEDDTGAPQIHTSNSSLPVNVLLSTASHTGSDQL